MEKINFLSKKGEKIQIFEIANPKIQEKDKKQAKFKKLKHSSFLKYFKVLILKIPTFIVKHPNTSIHLKPIFHYFEIMELLNQLSHAIIGEAQNSKKKFEACDWIFFNL